MSRQTEWIKAATVTAVVLFALAYIAFAVVFPILTAPRM